MGPERKVPQGLEKLEWQSIEIQCTEGRQLKAVPHNRLCTAFYRVWKIEIEHTLIYRIELIHIQTSLSSEGKDSKIALLEMMAILEKPL